MAPFRTLPPFGVIPATILALSGVCIVLMQPRADYHGIPVLISTRHLGPQAHGDWFAPLVLHVDKQKRWFLDGKPVSPTEFPGALKETLRHRPDLLVYLDADPSLDYRVPGRAIDMIQGMHARTIIVTPRSGRN